MARVRHLPSPALFPLSRSLADNRELYRIRPQVRWAFQNLQRDDGAMKSERTHLRIPVCGLPVMAALIVCATSMLVLAQEQQPSATAPQKSPLLIVDKDKLKVEGRVALSIVRKLGWEGSREDDRCSIAIPDLHISSYHLHPFFHIN